MTNHTPLNIAIFGAGSIGCYLGGRLVQGGASVTFIGRPRFQQELCEHGLTLTHHTRGDIIVPAADIDFSLLPQAASKADIILVCVKSQDSAEAASLLKPHIQSGALIVSFQNGVSNADTLAAQLSDHDVLGGIVPFNVTGTGPGHFHCGTEGDLMVQNTEDENLSRLVGAFKAGGETLKPVDDIKAHQWGKLLVNLNNGLNTLLGGTLHLGLSQTAYRKAFAVMIEEGLGVLRGAGIEPEQFGKLPMPKMIKIMRLPNLLFKPIMANIMKIDQTARSSMLDDLEMGRGTEIDFLQGEIVTLAQKTGQTAPINEAVMEAVKSAFENGTSPKLSGKEILNLCGGGA